MNDQVLAYLPVITPVVTLITVMFGVFLQNRHVDALLRAEFGRLEAIIRSEFGRPEAVIKAESATLRLDIQRVEHRVKLLEDRAGIIVQP